MTSQDAYETHSLNRFIWNPCFRQTFWKVAPPWSSWSPLPWLRTHLWKICYGWIRSSPQVQHLVSNQRVKLHLFIHLPLPIPNHPSIPTHPHPPPSKPTTPLPTRDPFEAKTFAKVTIGHHVGPSKVAAEGPSLHHLQDLHVSGEVGRNVMGPYRMSRDGRMDLLGSFRWVERIDQWVYRYHPIKKTNHL